MRRENRRVAAMSWGAGDDMPPPKPNRVPHAGTSIAFATHTHTHAQTNFILRFIDDALDGYSRRTTDVHHCPESGRVGPIDARE